jgi:hypothetical protein
LSENCIHAFFNWQLGVFLGQQSDARAVVPFTGSTLALQKSASIAGTSSLGGAGFNE